MPVIRNTDPKHRDHAKYPRTVALLRSHLWPILPTRLRGALVSSAVRGNDAEAPDPTRAALIAWLRSASAQRLPLLDAKTREAAVQVLLGAEPK